MNWVWVDEGCVHNAYKSKDIRPDLNNSGIETSLHLYARRSNILDYVLVASPFAYGIVLNTPTRVVVYLRPVGCACNDAVRGRRFGKDVLRSRWRKRRTEAREGLALETENSRVDIEGEEDVVKLELHVDGAGASEGSDMDVEGAKGVEALGESLLARHLR